VPNTVLAAAQFHRLPHTPTQACRMRRRSQPTEPEGRASDGLAQPVHDNRRARAHQRVEQRQHTGERVCLGQPGELGHQQSRRHERELGDRKSEAGLRVRAPIYADFGPRAISLIGGKRVVNSQRPVGEQAATGGQRRTTVLTDRKAPTGRKEVDPKDRGRQEKDRRSSRLRGV
jgi:hypothetical protein